MVHQRLGESVLERAFGLLSVFSEDRRVLSLTEIAGLTGLPKSTTHRIINDLVQLGALERQERGYKIGLALIGQIHSAPMGLLRNAAMPALLELHGRIGHTVHLGILRDREILVIEKVDHRSQIRVPTAVGSRYAAHGSAMGKAILANRIPETMDLIAERPLTRSTPATITDADRFRRQLEQVSLSRVAEDNEETVAGLSCVGSAVMCDGVPVGAVSITFPREVVVTPRHREFISYSAGMIGRLVHTERHRRRFYSLPETPTN